MAPLTVKLWRDLWRLRSQSFAIALVIAAGVGMVVMSVGMMRSIENSRDAYYAAQRFADVYAPVTRAPESVLRQVSRLPGVAAAESRLSTVAALDVPGFGEPVTARLHSLPAGDRPINGVLLRSGRLPDPRRPREAVANAQFAEAAGLALGDRIAATVRGNRLELTIVGTVLSPEYVYAIAPGQIIPDDRRFGVLWIDRASLAGALDLTGAFNEVLVELRRGASAEEVIRRLDLLLERYGGVTAYARDQQISDRFVSNEIDELRTMTSFLPPIFLGVAAFLLNIVLARLVETERETIGLLKAFGYGDATIMRHYAQLALLLSAGGIALGFALGTWLGRGIARLYQRFFVFPFLDFDGGIDAYAIAALVALGAVLAGSMVAVRRAARLAPAEAMRPPTPPAYGSAAARRLSALAWLDEPSRMILRDLLRQPVRSALTVTGIACALALYIASAGATDNVDRMIEIAFERAERQDVTVTFAEPRDARALRELARLPGVRRVEPVRSVAARLRAGVLAERQGLTASRTGNDLSRVVDLDGRRVEPPDFGLLLSASLARKLGVGRGDVVEVEIAEGRRPRLRLPVTGTVESPLGSPAYMALPALNRLLLEGTTVSGAALAVDADRAEALYRRLKTLPMVVGVAPREAALRGIRDTVAENMGLVTLFNTGFAVMVVFGVTYNAGRIMLSERARDLASLRVLGYRTAEVAYVLLGALALLTLAALPLGVLLGIGLSRLLVEQFSGDLYTIPFGVAASTLGDGALVVLAASAATALLIGRRVARLDLVRALKTRE